MGSDMKERVKEYYGRWAASYGDPADDGWFAWVRAREMRLVYKMLDIKPGQSILDVGCGSGVYAIELQKQHEVWAIDFAPEMVERVRGLVARCMRGDVEELALGRTFDRILCLGVLEWVRSPQAALARLAKHLGGEGRLVVLVPRTGLGGWVYRLTKRRDGLSVLLYSPSALRQMAEAVGLRYLEHRTPFPHNFVMAFRRAVE